jgi:hypothetical protein
MKHSANPAIDLNAIVVRPLEDAAEKDHARHLLDSWHYLQSPTAVGEQIWHGVFDSGGQWLGVLIFCAASRRLRARDVWIGWTEEQRRRRLALLANNSRFLLLPERTVPNLASRTLRLSLARLSQDWQSRYGHPILLVETFVDPEHFCGTTYSASGWSELGHTSGHRRVKRDFYVEHGKPKRLFAIELARNARRSLSAEKLKPTLAPTEAKVPHRPTQSPAEIRSIIEHFKTIPDYRTRIGLYPLWSLLAIVLMAHLCGAPRGQKDLEKFASGLSDAQRAALGIRRKRKPKTHPQDKDRFQRPTPKQPTFCRLMAGIDPDTLEQTILQIQRQIRGQPDPSELIAIDGKQPRHGNGDTLLSAVTASSQFYLGSALVPTQKTNEIPVARQLFQKLDLDGRLVSLDALHTQDKTARALVLEHGADYLLTVKDNQSTLHHTLERLIEEPPPMFNPEEPPPAPDSKKKPPAPATTSPPAPTPLAAANSTKAATKSESCAPRPSMPKP